MFLQEAPPVVQLNKKAEPPLQSTLSMGFLLAFRPRACSHPVYTGPRAPLSFPASIYDHAEE